LCPPEFAPCFVYSPTAEGLAVIVAMVEVP
jgi:hypothetical protein